MLRRLCMLAVLLTLANYLPAQDVPDSTLTLQRIFSSRDFFGERFGPARWLEVGSGYTTVESSADVPGGQDIVRYDPENGDREVIISADRLIPEGVEAPLRVEDYTWSEDGSKLLIYTNSQRVWRLNTRGDYWVLGLEDGTLRQLGGDAAPSTLMFAKFSPDGGRVGYVRENNVYVENLDTGEITAVTTDGSRTIINGTFDWVYEEEFQIRDGFRWSPDGTKIAYWQLDAEGIGEFLLINNTDSLYSYTIPLQYPKTGTTNSSCRVGVASADGGDTVWFEPTDDLRNHYIARMDWAANSDEIVFQHLNRLQNTLEITLGDVRTGEMRVIFTDTDDAWIDVGDDLHWLDDGARFTWVSERDGWRHLYTITRDGEPMLLTPGDYDLLSVESIDDEDGWVYIIASPDNPTQRYLYRVPLDGSGTLERVTPADEPGTHSYQIDAGADWAIHTVSTFDRPHNIDLVTLPDHEVAKTFVDNAELQSRLDALTLGQTEFLRIDIGEAELDAWMVKPADFDPDLKYPVLYFVYGEPAGQTVLDRWFGGRGLWHHYLATEGYIIISIDNRGTPAPRGRDWRKIVYGEVGVQSSKDQAAAARVVNTWPFVDSTRIAIWGWSGGGSSTLNALFRYPEIYHTGMSIAPVPDQRYYDTIYQERYMGTPQGNPEGYAKGSPITYAENLEGNLLLVHGTGDDNVHYQGSEALINKLIEHNKMFSMMAYPNRSHGIFEGRGTTRHLFETLTKFLLEHNPPGGR